MAGHPDADSLRRVAMSHDSLAAATEQTSNHHRQRACECRREADSLDWAAQQAGAGSPMLETLRLLFAGHQ